VVNLRDHARGKDCKIRLPGVCNFNPETTVLCHARLAGLTGMGQKAPDLLGAHGCSACHDEVDGRTRVLEREFVRLCFYEGVLRTQASLIAEGVI
jgi:hypothetical protein